MKPQSSRRQLPVVVRTPRFSGQRERGIIVIITLICLVVLLLSSIALVRSFTNANIVAGSVAIKRDMVNQAQRGMSLAALAFTNALLNTSAERTNAVAGLNYSPCILPSDAFGIPVMLEDSDAAFGGTTDLDGTHDPQCAASAVAVTTNDIVDPTTLVSVRYVIDRLCVNTAAAAGTSCVVSKLGQVKSGTAQINRVQGASAPVFRISVRVKSGNLSSYLQTTVS